MQMPQQAGFSRYLCVSNFGCSESAPDIGHRVPILKAYHTKATLRGIQRERNKLGEVEELKD